MPGIEVASRERPEIIPTLETAPDLESFTLYKLGKASVEGEVRSVISADQYTAEFLEGFFPRVAHFKKRVEAGSPIDARVITSDPVVSLFNEPSTRTRFSFDIAAKRLNLQVVTTEAGKVFSSMIKGESIEDTARNIAGYYPSAVVARFSETGEAQKMAISLGNIPLLNGGDGKGEHPTQSLLDAFTILERKGQLNNLNVVMGGDMANGRTARSLAKILALYEGNTITFVSPEELRMGQDVINTLERKGVEVHETSSMNDVLPDADIVYWTRLQAERFKTSDPSKQEEMRKKKLAMIALQPDFCIGEQQLGIMRPDAVLLHPLPKVKPGFIDTEGDELQPEIKLEVDNDTRAAYFEQSSNGMPVRMALLEWALQPKYGEKRRMYTLYSNTQHMIKKLRKAA
jgi:aspartate carbamoyltransferase catalytic subunit